MVDDHFSALILKQSSDLLEESCLTLFLVLFADGSEGFTLDFAATKNSGNFSCEYFCVNHHESNPCKLPRHFRGILIGYGVCDLIAVPRIVELDLS